MASVSQPSVALPLYSGASATIRIEPLRSFFELRLREVWAYRELLYFFIWRYAKSRFKQTDIRVLWAVMQPLLAMLAFTFFFGYAARLFPNAWTFPDYGLVGFVDHTLRNNPSFPWIILHEVNSLVVVERR